MLKTTKAVYLTPKGDATFDPNDGQNELLAHAGSNIDDHTVESLGLEKLFAEDAEKDTKAGPIKSSLLEQAKTRQESKAPGAKPAPKHEPAKHETPKTEPAKAEGGNK